VKKRLQSFVITTEVATDVSCTWERCFEASDRARRCSPDIVQLPPRRLLCQCRQRQTPSSWTAASQYSGVHRTYLNYCALAMCQRVSHLNARGRLRSSTTSALVAPRTVRFIIGDRTFPATAASVWNSLPAYRHETTWSVEPANWNSLSVTVLWFYF